MKPRVNCLMSVIVLTISFLITLNTICLAEERDFYGIIIPQEGEIDIGPCEYIEGTFINDPVVTIAPPQDFRVDSEAGSN